MVLVVVVSKSWSISQLRSKSLSMSINPCLTSINLIDFANRSWKS